MKSPKKKSSLGSRKVKASYHHGQLKESILLESLRVMREKGAHHLSLREVARGVGVTPMAAYRHFSDKEAIMAELAAQGFARLDRDLLESVKGSSFSGVTWFEDLAWAYVRLAVESPEHLRLMFGGFVEDFEKFPVLAQKAGCAFERLVLIMKEAQEKGALRKGNPTVFAMTCWSLSHGLAMLLIDKELHFVEGIPQTAEALARELARNLFSGMKA